MKKAIILCCFLCYMLSIFIVKSPIWIVFVFVINLFGMFFFHVSFFSFLKSLLPLTFLLTITFLLNFMFADVDTAFTTTLKLLFAYQGTFLFSKQFTYSDLAESIEILVSPIKLIKKNPKDITLILCIAIAFLPILGEELRTIKSVFTVKGFPMSLKNILKHPSLILAPFFIGILEHVGEIEFSLRVKGYE